MFTELYKQEWWCNDCNDDEMIDESMIMMKWDNKKQEIWQVMPSLQKWNRKLADNRLQVGLINMRNCGFQFQYHSFWFQFQSLLFQFHSF